MLRCLQGLICNERYSACVLEVWPFIFILAGSENARKQIRINVS